MRIGIWGAGDIGRSLAYRLAVTEYTSKLFWINRDPEKIKARIVDIESGLALCPKCESIIGVNQADAGSLIEDTDVIVISIGRKVEKDESREDQLEYNRVACTESVIPTLKDYHGIVLVISNPVDLIARHIYLESGLPRERVFGLGTLVETARLQYYLASYSVPKARHRDVNAHAIGPHNDMFVPVVPPNYIEGIKLLPRELERKVELARSEVICCPKRVKVDNRSTQHPVIEGIHLVLKAISEDSAAVLTVSTLDIESPDSLFYSMQCKIGRNGISWRRSSNTYNEVIQGELVEAVKALRKLI